MSLVGEFYPTNRVGAPLVATGPLHLLRLLLQKEPQLKLHVPPEDQDHQRLPDLLDQDLPGQRKVFSIKYIYIFNSIEL